MEVWIVKALIYSVIAGQAGYLVLKQDVALWLRNRRGGGK